MYQVCSELHIKAKTTVIHPTLINQILLIGNPHINQILIKGHYLY